MNIVLCLKGYVLISLMFWAFSGFAYYVNAKRDADSLAKKNYHPAAIFMFPLWPLYPIVFIFLFALGTILLAVFLVLFTAVLLFARKPFIITWLSKVALKIGNKLLQINTLLIRIFFPQVKSKTI